jgi:hypothetical protein
MDKILSYTENSVLVHRPAKGESDPHTHWISQKTYREKYGKNRV